MKVIDDEAYPRLTTKGVERPDRLRRRQVMKEHGSNCEIEGSLWKRQCEGIGANERHFTASCQGLTRGRQRPLAQVQRHTANSASVGGTPFDQTAGNVGSPGAHVENGDLSQPERLYPSAQRPEDGGASAEQPINAPQVGICFSHLLLRAVAEIHDFRLTAARAEVEKDAGLRHRDGPEA